MRNETYEVLLLSDHIDVLITLMNKGLFHFRELVTHWLIQMPYLESVLLGEQIVRF